MWKKNLNTLAVNKKDLRPGPANMVTDNGLRPRVFIGLSGGVDSAVSAALLKKQGFDVVGVFIKVWQPDFLPCSWREERRDAMRVAIALDIPFLFFDFEKEYKKNVVDAFVAEYQAGRTPNPDVLCNREIKFGEFWKKAKDLGADFIATGHYVNIVGKGTEVFSAENLPDSRAVALRDPLSLQYSLHEGKDKEKDQSYFLWGLSQEDLSHTMFPVGHLEKKEVRSLAHDYALPVSDKKDSQGICFIGEVSMDDFLSHFVSTSPGEVLNTKGEVIGTHKGALFFTIGERRGFEITKKPPEGGAFYVLSKDMKKNTITVSNSKPEIISLSPKKIKLKNTNWIREPDNLPLSARIRYRGEKVPVTISRDQKGLVVEFEKPMPGLSLGQSIVFYHGDLCLGGGVMDRVL